MCRGIEAVNVHENYFFLKSRAGRGIVAVAGSELVLPSEAGVRKEVIKHDQAYVHHRHGRA